MHRCVEWTEAAQQGTSCWLPLRELRQLEFGQQEKACSLGEFPGSMEGVVLCWRGVRPPCALWEEEVRRLHCDESIRRACPGGEKQQPEWSTGVTGKRLVSSD